MLAAATTSDLTQPAVLLTIVSEAILKDSLLALLKNLKVRGYTVHHVEAQDSYGTLMGNTPGDTTNIEIRAIVTREISDVVLHTLQKHRGDHPVLAYRQEVETLLT